MRFSQQLQMLVAVFAILSAFIAAGREYTTNQSNVIENVKFLLIHEGEKLSGNTTSGALIPSDDIVSQIITLLNCGVFPFAPNSHLQYSLDYDTKSLRLSQTCDRFFKTKQKLESLQVQCKYKKWIFDKIQCERTTCPRLTAPTGGHFSSSDNTYNTTVYFWCSRGFTINGTDKLFCEENGHWNLPPPTCHLSLCRPISSPRHGFVSNQEGTPVNQTVEFTCESDYTLIGDAVLRCEENGRWNTSAPVCKKMCIVPNCTHQLEGVRLIPGFKTLSIGSLIQQGQRVIYSCRPGYAVPSPGISTCIRGSWRPTIQCRKTCTVVEIANGKHVLSGDSFTVEYVCLSGYQLIGKPKLSCTPNITWDGEIPICTKMCTLSKRNNVSSYRNKQTYEIIPFGTQVVNGTQLYEVCGSNSSEVIERECVDGALGGNYCKDGRVRFDAHLLKIFHNGQWHNICYSNGSICGIFGYKITTFPSCTSCQTLDVNEYNKTSRILFIQKTYGYDINRCVRCF